MADWFKFYEDELDREEFQAAWSECKALPCILLWSRCQATKQKSDRFKINNKYQMIGLAQKLKITEHELKQGFDLLQEIGYVTLLNDEVVCNDWEKHQSKYLYERQRKQKLIDKCKDVPTLYPQSEPIVPSLYPQSTLRGEERREEKIRRGEKKERKESELLSKYLTPLFIESYYQAREVFDCFHIELSSPVSSAQHLEKLLQKENLETVLDLLRKALRSGRYPKLNSSFGLLNFCERYEMIKNSFKEPELYKPEPSPSFTAIPLEVKQRMDALLKQREGTERIMLSSSEKIDENLMSNV